MSDQIPKFDPASEASYERVYDAEIAPLMARIISVCKERGIPLVADFQLGRDFFCTTAVIPDGADQHMQNALDTMKYGLPGAIQAAQLRDTMKKGGG